MLEGVTVIDELIFNVTLAQRPIALNRINTTEPLRSLRVIEIGRKEKSEIIAL
jgi:hypothetical protein